MPKMKSHRGLAKRVKITGSGKLKTKKQRRHLAKPATVHATDFKRIKEMLVK